MRELRIIFIIAVFVSSCETIEKSSSRCLSSYMIKCSKKEFNDTVTAFYKSFPQHKLPPPYDSALRLHYSDKYAENSEVQKEVYKLGFDTLDSYRTMDADSVNFNFYFSTQKDLSLWANITASQDDWNDQPFELCLKGYTHKRWNWMRKDKLKTEKQRQEYVRLFEDSILKRMNVEYEIIFN